MSRGSSPWWAAARSVWRTWEVTEAANAPWPVTSPRKKAQRPLPARKTS
ncbi:hypothetical protein OOZ19_03330 [Saccharopolyspora sp. NFXS83]|nr:hypothetical protein [Saccharopolyspora sp. NFXS83]MCX2729259.1 hypothetical protein [Saccharopolyspora sp. NFXS83]